MPRMSGLDLAKQLLAVRPRLPMLMNSGFVRPEDQAAADSVGIRHILPNRLAQAIDEALHATRQLPGPPQD
jgi:DNA-binding NarL/FixJ family response regulator